MPRSRQAYLRNAVVTHNPMQRMLFDPTSIAKQGPSVMAVPDITMVVEDMLAGWTNLITEVPNLFEDVINAILGAIDNATGLDLSSLGVLIDDILSWIDNAGAAFQQGWLGFQQLINGIVGGVDKDVTDLITALSQTGTDVATLQADWQIVLDDLGLGAIPDLALFLADIQSWIDQVGASLTQGWLGFQQFLTGITGSIDASVADSVAVFQTLQTEFGALQTDFTANSAAFTTLLDSEWTAIQDYTSWSTYLAAAESAWSTYVTTVSNLTSGEFATVQQILDTLLGIDPGTGKVKGAVDTVYPTQRGRGVVSASAYTTKAIVTASLSGKGSVLPRPGSSDVQLWQTFTSITGRSEHSYLNIRGQGVLSANAVSSRFIIPVSLSGRGALIPIGQEWQTFRSITGVVQNVYPTLSSRGLVKATAVSVKFTLPATLSSRGALTSVTQAQGETGNNVSFGLNPPLSGRGVLKGAAVSVRFTIPANLPGRGALIPIGQEWQTFNSITGVMHLVYSNFPGRGVSTANAKSTKFILSASLPSRGALSVTVQDVQILPSYPIYGLNPPLTGRGVLKASAAASKFISVTTLSSRGALASTVQWFISSASGSNNIYGLNPSLPGRGVLKAGAVSAKFSLPDVLSSRGALTATVQSWQTFQSIVGVVQHVYALPPGRGVLTATAVSVKSLVTTALSGRGALTTRSGGPSVGQLEQNLINALWLALTGGGTGTVSELQSAFSDLMSLLGWTSSTNLGTGSPVAPAITSVPILGTLVPATNSTVANDIFGGSTFWASLMSLLFPSSGGSVGSSVAPTAVTNVLGGANLGADLTALVSSIFTGAGGTGGASGPAIQTQLINIWNNLFGISNPPATSTVATAALPNIAAGNGAGQSSDLLTHLTNVAAQTGALGATATAAALAALQTQSNTLNSVAAALQNQQTLDAGSMNSGESFSVQFANYSAGTFSVTPFKVTYGNIPGAGAHGTGTFVINSSNQAAWSAVNNGDVSGIGIYTPGFILSFTGTPSGGTFTLTYVNPDTGVSRTTSALAYNASASTIQTALQGLTNMPASGVAVVANSGVNRGFTITVSATGPITVVSSVTGGTAVMTNYGYTLTNYQKLEASLAGLPNGAGSRNYAILRCNAAGTDYVYGVVYLAAGTFQLNWEVGCYVAGTKTVFGSGSNAPLNLNFTFIAGVGTQANRFQGYSGGIEVFDVTDAGNVASMDSSHRYWGFRSDTFSNGQITPAPASYIGCADNQPPTIPGSGIRLYHTGTASITEATGVNAGYTGLGDGTTQFWDTISEISNDMTVLSNVLIGSFDSRIANAQTSGVQVANAGRYHVTMRSDISAATCSSAAVSICPVAYRYNSVGTLQETRLFPSPGFFVNGFGGQYNAGFFGGGDVIGCQAGDIIQMGYYLAPGPGGSGTLSALAFTGEATGGHTYCDVTLANWSFN